MGVLCAGAALLIWELTSARVIYGKLVFAGAFMIAIGGYLLWDEFVSPRLHKSSQKD